MGVLLVFAGLAACSRAQPCTEPEGHVDFQVVEESFSGRDGVALGEWRLQIGSTLVSFERRADDMFEAELVVDGKLVWVKRVPAAGFAVTKVADIAPAPLPAQECVRKIAALAATKVAPPDWTAEFERDGIVTVRVGDGYKGHCGRYTRRVWLDRQG